MDQGVGQPEVSERAQIVAWLRWDADVTEVEAWRIVKNTTGNARENAAEWDMLVRLKRGLADAIERGDFKLDGPHKACSK